MEHKGFHRLFSGFKYYARAKTIYNIHSPYLFRLLSRMSDQDIRYYDFDELYLVRKYLENQQIEFTEPDPGAGTSSIFKKRSLQKVMRTSVSPTWKSESIYRLLSQLNPKKLLELGTSVGLSTLYLAKSNPISQILTIEAQPQLHSIAQALFTKFEMRNIQSFLGNIDNNLEDIILQNLDIDFVVMDANHRYEPTVRYFNLLLTHLNPKWILVDDIYWSKDMTKAWQKIKENERFNISIDFYYFGILMKVDALSHREDFAFIPFRYKPWQNGLFG